MLNWNIEKNQYEDVHTTTFGNYEITIIAFCANGGYRAWMRAVPSVSNIFAKTYGNNYSLEEVKKNFVNDLQEYLDEKSSYWSEMSNELWMTVNFEE